MYTAHDHERARTQRTRETTLGALAVRMKNDSVSIEYGKYCVESRCSK